MFLMFVTPGNPHVSKALAPERRKRDTKWILTDSSWLTKEQLVGIQLV